MMYAAYSITLMQFSREVPECGKIPRLPSSANMTQSVVTSGFSPEPDAAMNSKSLVESEIVVKIIRLVPAHVTSRSKTIAASGIR